MQNIGNEDDPDQMARRQAALAAQDRARQVAGNIAAAHAADVYNQARQNAVGYNPAPPGYVPPPPGQVVPGIPVGGPPPPPPPPFAGGAMNALADVSTAMTAIVDTLTRRSGNDSRRRDGEVVIEKDISKVFDEVPEDILERVKYVESVENRLLTNMSGVRYKTDRQDDRTLVT